LDELVFALPTTDLWNLISYKEQGFIPGNRKVLKQIVQKGLFRKRSLLEEDPSFKQLIPYALISSEGSFYLFKRGSGQNEERLHHQLTLGVGGHMNPCKAVVSEEQYIIHELKRELFEELKLSNSCLINNIGFFGFINDDTIAVGRAHIGLLYHITLSNKEVTVKERDKMTAAWIEKAELSEIYAELETWSQIAFDCLIK